jgi:hypothetical protein
MPHNFILIPNDTVLTYDFVSSTPPPFFFERLWLCLERIAVQSKSKAVRLTSSPGKKKNGETTHNSLALAQLHNPSPLSLASAAAFAVAATKAASS